tara:strand:+ start:148 stop:516 length:369 start_codon:yes stop_codon:yes gene_type:complete
MNDWEKALWMIDEGFTPEQLKELCPSDADAWLRLKPMLYGGEKKSWREERKVQVLKEMLDAFDKCEPVEHGAGPLYRVCDVRDAHIKSTPTFYVHLKQLGIRPKNIHGRAWMPYPATTEVSE